MIRTLPLFALPFLALHAVATPALAQEEVTPGSVVAAAAPGEWREIAPDDLLVMQLAPDATGEPRRVVIQLMPAPFSQPWVENIRTLARAHWWDGTSIYRVVDNWVAQWGGGEGEQFTPPALPAGVTSPLVDYVTPAPEEENLQAGRFGLIDSYAEAVDFRDGLPIAQSGDWQWPTHCYGSVGVARDLAPDTGTGAELYAVIGHAPRQLDRIIAVVGRVVEGIQYLSVLPRGTAEAGVYATREEDTPILSVRLASDMADAPRFEYLDTDSESFARYVHIRANRSDSFYSAPAGGVDICNVTVPTRPIAPDEAS